ncbi:uncharacterized protein LOC114308803 [Camellia sinensis]|uniref:uncharacterized protein LOC114308803 n=1 Tax=Camellia sinensis TaxID=4442 RepID=UPI00103677B3|nr:uncharacterized protein LOC114308803 [Camellia sinensis]
MDVCFKGTEEFIAVYIDDILVFSPDEQTHEKHILAMIEICRKNGLILSPTKMKIAAIQIDFLGSTIGHGEIKLQAHIITKSLLQRLEDRFTYDHRISGDEYAEIQALLSNEEEDAMGQAQTALQQLVKIQQLKLEAVARAAVSDNHHSDKLPEVYQRWLHGRMGRNL